MLTGTLQRPKRTQPQSRVADTDKKASVQQSEEKARLEAQNKTKQSRIVHEKQAAAQKREERVRQALSYLKQHYPVFDEIRLLSIGAGSLVLESYRALQDKPFPITYLQQAILSWTSSLAYYQACLTHTHRYDLYALPAEALMEKDRQYARARIHKHQSRISMKKSVSIKE
jgi:sRNA-binding protein